MCGLNTNFNFQLIILTNQPYLFMKKITLSLSLSLLYLLAICQPDPKTTAAAAPNANQIKYRRSSLYTMIIPGGAKEEHSDTIQLSYIAAPLPDKFNNHNLTNRVATTGMDEEKQVTQYLADNHVARDMVAKWFNRNANGSFNMNMIADRGAYDATQMDVTVAKSSQRGTAMLSDAGEELIGNTFVLVTRFKFIKIDEQAKKAAKASKFLISIAGAATGTNVTAINKAVDMTADMMNGFGVQAHSYLYQLEWNDSVAAVFYNQYWTDSAHLDPAKKAAFDNSNIFKLKFVGEDKARQPLFTTKFDKRTKAELIGDATTGAAAKVIVVLQRKHQEFRTKTPIFSVGPIVAKIGMKEGLGPKEKNPKFEVLEQVIDDKGRTKYKRVAVVKVDKKHIWDNRHVETDGVTGNNDGTIFTGAGKNVFPGMLLKQIN